MPDKIKAEDIRAWVESNATVRSCVDPLTSEEIGHIAMCMEHIQRWYYEGVPLGRFLSAIVANNFTEACFRADDTNRKAFHLYALFLHNHLPDDYINHRDGEVAMPDKPCCAKCGKEYKMADTGIGVLEHKGDGSLYRISAADLLECPGCGHQITWGYGQAIHYSAEPDKVKSDIAYYQRHTQLIKVY